MLYVELIILILVVITIHEFSHALVAEMLGDPTPRLAGRLTLNPISHIDPLGFLMLLIVRFGWAKPVPINPYNFRDPVKGEMMVSLAGPLSNIFVAWAVSVVVRFTPLYYYVMNNALIVSFVSDFIFLNLSLAVFNLIPIPPLDGSHLLEPYIPEDARQVLEQYGFFILIFLLVFPPTSMLLLNIIRILFNFLT